MQYCVVSNYGDESIALLQWLHEHQVKHVYVIYVDTGWAAESWSSRVRLAQNWAADLGFHVQYLVPALQFEEMVKDRNEFPTPKFQWCAGILKGLPILDWLDKEDPGCEMTVILASRRSLSPSLSGLEEYIAESDHFGERRVWHPLYLHTDEQRDHLIGHTPFPVLNHRSLECDPCINSQTADFRRLANQDIDKQSVLENTIHQYAFSSDVTTKIPFRDVVESVKKYSEDNAIRKARFDMGCGTPFGCGL